MAENTCPICGSTRFYYHAYGEYHCGECGRNFDEDLEEIEDDEESLSVYEAAEIWLSHGKDEDYMFGYSEEELEEAS